METDFAGTRPFELELTNTTSNKSFFDLEKLELVEEIENYLKDSCGVGNLISPLSLFRGANKAFYGGDNSRFRLPQTQQEVNRFYEAILQTEHADEMQHYLSTEGGRLRISGRLPNMTLKDFKKIENKFEHFFKRKNYKDSFSYHLTGSAVLLDKIT